MSDDMMNDGATTPATDDTQAAPSTEAPAEGGEATEAAPADEAAA